MPTTTTPGATRNANADVPPELSLDVRARLLELDAFVAELRGLDLAASDPEVAFDAGWPTEERG